MSCSCLAEMLICRAAPNHLSTTPATFADGAEHRIIDWQIGGATLTAESDYKI